MKPQQSGPKGRGEQRWQGAFLGRFHAYRDQAASFGVDANAVQENRLPNTAEAVKDQTSR
jgi:hypothetical protein